MEWGKLLMRSFGAILTSNAAYGLVTGSVVAPDSPRGFTLGKMSENPGGFWFVVVFCAVLGLFMLFGKDD